MKKTEKRQVEEETIIEFPHVAKKPFSDMKITEKRQVEQEVVTDIICDACGQSCKTDSGFERMTLTARWGYSSGKDEQAWAADLCEKCVDNMLAFVNFRKKYTPCVD